MQDLPYKGLHLSAAEGPLTSSGHFFMIRLPEG